mmetsp:Transcript_3408/g.10590  ORF Transcript_3408/g.10590 Transcript_3408/m.10590 type:complete len:242 (+) Transcript_3408:438-1163(+)
MPIRPRRRPWPGQRPVTLGRLELKRLGHWPVVRTAQGYSIIRNGLTTAHLHPLQLQRLVVLRWSRGAPLPPPLRRRRRWLPRRLRQRRPWPRPPTRTAPSGRCATAAPSASPSTTTTRGRRRTARRTPCASPTDRTPRPSSSSGRWTGRRSRSRRASPGTSWTPSRSGRGCRRPPVTAEWSTRSGPRRPARSTCGRARRRTRCAWAGSTAAAPWGSWTGTTEGSGGGAGFGWLLPSARTAG